MILKTNTGREFEVTELDKDNEICFEIESQGFESNQTIWIPIKQIPDLIKFLQKEVDSFNDSNQADA